MPSLPANRCLTDNSTERVKRNESSIESGNKIFNFHIYMQVSYLFSDPVDGFAGMTGCRMPYLSVLIYRVQTVPKTNKPERPLSDT